MRGRQSLKHPLKGTILQLPLAIAKDLPLLLPTASHQQLQVVANSFATFMESVAESNGDWRSAWNEYIQSTGGVIVFFDNKGQCSSITARYVALEPISY